MQSYTNLGGVLADVGRYDEAEAACRRALELAPQSVGAHNNLAWALICRGRELERAVELLQQGLRLSGWRQHRSACLGTLSHAYRKLGRVDQAVQAAQEALELAGRGHRPRLAELYYGLGLAQRAAGQREEARASFQRVFSLDPRGRYAPEARRALREMGCG